jgi:hypothetical protein
MPNVLNLTTPRTHKPSAAALAAAIRESWSGATSVEGDRWSSSNLAFGQCAVSALVVQDYLGGTILRNQMDGVSHYWNRFADGTELDLTRGQFRKSAVGTVPEERSRAYLLSSDDTRRRYYTLAHVVARTLRASSTTHT